MSSSAEVMPGDAQVRQRHHGGAAQDVFSTDDGSRGVDAAELPDPPQDPKTMKTYGKTPDGTGKELCRPQLPLDRTGLIRLACSIYCAYYS